MNVGVGRLLRRRSGSVAMVSMRVDVGGGEGTPLGGETPRGGAEGGTPARTPGGGWGGSGEEVAGYSLIALLPAQGSLHGSSRGSGMVLISPSSIDSVFQVRDVEEGGGGGGGNQRGLAGGKSQG